MSGVVVRPAPRDAAPPEARRRFGLDTPLPADRRTVECALLRHLAESRPAVVPLLLGSVSAANGVATAETGARAPVEAGFPDLLLLAPGGQLVFVKIKTQAQTLSRADRAFADLCRERAIPLVVVRSLPEAKRALDTLML